MRTGARAQPSRTCGAVQSSKYAQSLGRGWRPTRCKEGQPVHAPGLGSSGARSYGSWALPSGPQKTRACRAVARAMHVIERLQDKWANCRECQAESVTQMLQPDQGFQFTLLHARIGPYEEPARNL
eukprot:1910582-Pleurochrysis_carterae.AAC.7